MVDLVQTKSGNFNGEYPGGALSTQPHRIVWAEGDNQGLIDPLRFGVTQPVRVLRLSLFMAGQSTWKIELLDENDVGLLANGTNETFFSDEAISFLTGNQKLKVTTTGAGTTRVKLVCTVVDPYHFSPAGKGV